jgi:hypothetical protein
MILRGKLFMTRQVRGNLEGAVQPAGETSLNVPHALPSLSSVYGTLLLAA